MKILQFPAYVTINGRKEFSRSTTGYGYMTMDIATSIAQRAIEVDLLTQSCITKGLFYNGVNIIKRTWSNVLLNVKLRHIINALQTIFKDRISLKRIPYIFIYNISMGYFEKVILENNYDLVHIHGIGYYTLPIIKTCEKMNVKYVVTLHGLNSFSSSIIGTIKEKRIEKEFLRKAAANKTSVTVISSGIRTDILAYLNISDSATFSVISNGCTISTNSNIANLDIRSKYNISNNTKIMLCVGNIGNNKNQLQIVRAFSKLPTEDQNKLTILFLGADFSNGHFHKAINKSSIKSNLIYCGNVPKNEVSAYYKQADYNIVASISEGFGLSIIEGFVHGLPCLTFHDLHSVPDLYNKHSMMLMNERTDEALAKGISRMLDSSFDKHLIKKHAQQFSLDKMGEKYVNYFHTQIQNN